MPVAASDEVPLAPNWFVRVALGLDTSGIQFQGKRARKPDMADSTFSADEILHYWFGEDLSNTAAIETHSRRWFRASAAVDHEIQVRFGDWIEPLAESEPDSFDSPENLLAAIVALDQFPRHLFRGSARAFAFDDKALQLLDKALLQAWDVKLSPLQTCFLYMPLQHAEDLQRQQQGLALLQELHDSADPLYRPFIATNLKYAEQHLQLIRRFGRFPHRNQALGRSSTGDEVAHMATDSRHFGQSPKAGD
jgi:uncharacterized protein (DUF924 family)